MTEVDINDCNAFTKCLHKKGGGIIIYERSNLEIIKLNVTQTEACDFLSGQMTKNEKVYSGSN